MNVIEKILAKASGNKEVRPGDVVVANVDLMVMHDLSSNFVMKVFENEMENAQHQPIRPASPSPSITTSPPPHKPLPKHSPRSENSPRSTASNTSSTAAAAACTTPSSRAAFGSPARSSSAAIRTRRSTARSAFSPPASATTPWPRWDFSTASDGSASPKPFRCSSTANPGPAVTPRDVSQYVIGRIGEDGAIYKALEYAGPWMQSLLVEDRMLFPLQSIDVGGKCGFINPDEKTIAFAKAFSGAQDFEMPVNDPGTKYADVLDIDVSKIEPQIACPPTVGNVRPVEEAVGIPVNIAEVGGSTGGRIEDIRVIARYFADRKVHPDVRLQIVPASRGAYGKALREGLFQILHDAGANIFPPSAGSNQAFNMGAMAEDEVMISTQARNFPGRNGHPNARHYLGSTLTVAASAARGRITDPRDM